MNVEILISELKFKALRSSGAGGQHVNKVSSKVELQFNLENSTAFSDDEKTQLLKTLTNRLTSDFRIIIQCDDSRSQHKNKEIVIIRFLELIKDGLVVKKKRKPTKIPKAEKRKRLLNKKIHSDKKANRKKPNLD